MRMGPIFRALGPVDLKSISRDSMLLLISVGSLALRYGVPPHPICNASSLLTWPITRPC